MVIEAATVRLYAPWVHSLKEKRMEVKSLVAKTRNRFNISIAEVDEQDTHKTIVLGFACVAGNISQADRIIESVLEFIERNTDAEITEVRREHR
jgi:uncharacterized protein YlxP (DUF503 family)